MELEETKRKFISDFYREEFLRHKSRSDTTYGSLTTLTLPWAIKGSVRGTVSVTLRNSHGQAISRYAPIP